MTRVLMLFLAICSAAGAAAAAQSIPEQSLQEELTQTADAHPVSFHTSFSSGTAFFFAKDGSVLAARHALLSPSDELANQLEIAVPQPPLNNIEKLHAVAVAQDRTLDLVLLRVPGYAGQPTAPAAKPEAQPEPAPSAAPRRARPAARRVRRARRRRHVNHRRRTRARTSGEHTPSVPVRVVWDGPLPGRS